MSKNEQLRALRLQLEAALQQLRVLELDAIEEESECDHPEEDRVDLSGMGAPEKWQCGLCEFVYEADKIEDEEENE